MATVSKVSIEYTETLSNSTDLAITHFMRWNGEVSVLKKIEDAINTFENAIIDNPFIYPVSPSLFDVAGISSVREANINGYRLLYEVEEQAGKKMITAFLLLGQRQSVREQLIKHCLIQR